MTDKDTLKEAIAALGEAAAEEQSIRFGHDVARTLHAALVTYERERQEREDQEPPAHEHGWSTLGWDRPAGGTAHVVQVCACGAAREVGAER